MKYHFIGINGIGMSALARILLDKKIPVSGSDLSMSDNTEQLVSRGAFVYKGHSAAHIASGDTIVFSSQIQKNNPEYVAARALKCPMMHRSELLAHLMGGSQTLAITGTHGKTTTSSLLTTVLLEGGYDPTFAVGGMLGGLNGKWGKGGFFVAEADESDGSFLNYHPQGAIVTNIEAEHLDHYKTEEALIKAFQTFLSQVEKPELLFYCGDDPILHTLAVNKGFSYGFSEHNHLKIENFCQLGWHSIFDLHFEEKSYLQVKVALSGEHNALNAASVFGLCLKLGIAEEKIRSGLENFSGVGRRCEKRFERGAVLFVDDYGHHPTEIEKTLKAVKTAAQERRLIAVFQPHRYSRLRDLFHAFSTAFERADFVYITDVYAAGEEPIEGIDALHFLDAIRKVSTVPCAYIAREKLVDELNTILRPHDLLLTFGAGDITRLHNDLIQGFCPKKLNRALYDVRLFGIDKEGMWITGKEAEELLTTQATIQSAHSRPLLDPSITRELQECELYIPILHGANGEDGTIQGFFEMLGKPYVGPDYRSAAICMDKVLTKRLAESAGVKTPKDVTFGHVKWLDDKEKLLKNIVDALPFPMYVKPVHLGSSVGITPVFTFEKLEEAIDLAFRFDTQVMVEEGKIGCRELEFAVLGNTHSFSPVAPGPGEKLAQGTFVDYQKKYGTNSVNTTLHPDLTAEILEKGKRLARTAYEGVGCTGMTRVDFLLDAQGEFWLFEMNAIPGLQRLSLFPKIWNREGLSPEQLFNRLVILAIERHHKQKRHYRCLSQN